jgi:hypothetical protein
MEETRTPPEAVIKALAPVSTTGAWRKNAV